MKYSSGFCTECSYKFKHTEPTRSGSLAILLAISWNERDSNTTIPDPSTQDPSITQRFGEGKTSLTSRPMSCLTAGLTSPFGQIAQSFTQLSFARMEITEALWTPVPTVDHLQRNFFCQISNCNILCCILGGLPLVLSLCTCNKNLSCLFE